MRGKKLWAQFWTDRQKTPKRNNCIEGLNFLSSYSMTEPENVLKDLQQGLRMTIAGKWGSGYVVIFPNTPREELIRARLATHPFKTSEWPEHEIDGLPNRRYSIFIYDEQTCPQFAKLAETDWRMEYSEGIPIYEKGFNAAFLKRTFPKLIRILKSIYQGGTPQPTVLKTITTESKTRKDMKQNRIKLTESQLKRMVSEAIQEELGAFSKDEFGNDIDGMVLKAFDNNDPSLLKHVIQETNYSLNDCLSAAYEKYGNKWYSKLGKIMTVIMQKWYHNEEI